jgi:hypothetical protein
MLISAVTVTFYVLQFLFIDGHDSHWDPDALQLLHDNHCFVFFLKAGDSENDQPNDNGPNALVKSIYGQKSQAWRVTNPVAELDVPRMNSLLRETWSEFKAKGGQSITHAFEVTGIHPLTCLADGDKARERARLGQMHAPAGISDVAELALLAASTPAGEGEMEITTTFTADPVVIADARRGGTNKRVVISKVAYDLFITSTVIPVQELKAYEQDKKRAKLNKVPDQVSRMNPNTKSGVSVNRDILRRAREVQDARLAQVKENEEAKKVTQDRRTAQERETADLIDKTLAAAALPGATAAGVIEQLKLPSPAMIKMVRQLGGDVKALANTKVGTLRAALAPLLQARAPLQPPSPCDDAEEAAAALRALCSGAFL